MGLEFHKVSTVQEVPKVLELFGLKWDGQDIPNDLDWLRFPEMASDPGHKGHVHTLFSKKHSSRRTLPLLLDNGICRFACQH